MSAATFESVPMPAAVVEPAPERAPIRFRRVELADIDQMAPWLFLAVQAGFPNASFGTIRAFLVQAHMASDQWCGRTDNACAVAFIEPGLLGSPKTIRVAFALGKVGLEDSEEVSELYYQIGLWAKRMVAHAVRVSDVSDADRFDLRARVGKLTKSEQSCWFVGGS
jgi:hypothetical protein